MAKWFKGKEISFAFGFNLSIGAMGSVIGGAVSPSIYSYTQSLGSTFLVGFAVCFFCSILSILLSILDKYADKVDEVTQNKISEEEKFKLQDLKNLNLTFWLLCSENFFQCMSIYTFTMVSTSLLQTKFKFSDIASPNLTNIFSLVNAILSPFLGYFVDRFGKRVHICNLIFKIICFYSNSCKCMFDDCSFYYNAPSRMQLMFYLNCANCTCRHWLITWRSFILGWSDICS